MNMDATRDNLFLADVTIARSSEDRRHLIFATTEQLDLGLLCPAKGCYVDGIFKLVRMMMMIIIIDV